MESRFPGREQTWMRLREIWLQSTRKPTRKLDDTAFDERGLSRKREALPGGSSRCRWFSAADFVRKCGESAVGALHRQITRVCDSGGAWGKPGSGDSSTSHGELVARGPGWRSWTAFRLLGHACCLEFAAGCGATGERSFDGFACSDLYVRGVIVCRSFLRPCSRIEDRSRGFAGSAEGERPRRQRRATPAAGSLRGRGSCDGACIARRSGIDDPYPRVYMAIGPSFQPGSRHHIQRELAFGSNDKFSRHARAIAPFRQ